MATVEPVTEEDMEDAVLGTVQATDPRSQQVMTSMIRHLHAFVRDVEPTEGELNSAIDWLTRVGQNCDEQRQEFVLFSDVMGISMLVDLINHRSTSGATESTVLGPFHAEAPEVENGGNITTGDEWEQGKQTFLHGRVLDGDGQPIAGAKVDFWQTDESGLYDSQMEGLEEANMRGILTTNENGQYWCRTVKPLGYNVPTDGPVGELMRACHREGHRPAHIHVMITAPGFHTLVTHIFPSDDEALDSDATFGVKKSLVTDWNLIEDAQRATQIGISNPFYEVEFNFVLNRHPEHD
ncbi:MAG: dioxygenase [Verrucomicrobiota bacterium]